MATLPHRIQDHGPNSWNHATSNNFHSAQRFFFPSGSLQKRCTPSVAQRKLTIIQSVILAKLLTSSSTCNLMFLNFPNASQRQDLHILCNCFLRISKFVKVFLRDRSVANPRPSRSSMFRRPFPTSLSLHPLSLGLSSADASKNRWELSLNNL